MKIQIYGERCSGTNYLEKLLVLNFQVEIIWDYGWKHFFGFADLSGTDDVLFIGIIRGLNDWANSLYRIKHHLPDSLRTDVRSFLENEFYSVDRSIGEIMTDRNMETNERYRNIFELRLTKNRWLTDRMPSLVKNYCLIIYEDLVSNFEATMSRLQSFGLKPKLTEFQNIIYYKGIKGREFIKRDNLFSINMRVLPKELLEQEHKLFSVCPSSSTCIPLQLALHGLSCIPQVDDVQPNYSMKSQVPVVENT